LIKPYINYLKKFFSACKKKKNIVVTLDPEPMENARGNVISGCDEEGLYQNYFKSGLK